MRRHGGCWVLRSRNSYWESMGLAGKGRLGSSGVWQRRLLWFRVIGRRVRLSKVRSGDTTRQGWSSAPTLEVIGDISQDICSIVSKSGATYLLSVVVVDERKALAVIYICVSLMCVSISYCRRWSIEVVGGIVGVGGVQCTPRKATHRGMHGRCSRHLLTARPIQCSGIAWSRLCSNIRKAGEFRFSTSKSSSFFF